MVIAVRLEQFTLPVKQALALAEEEALAHNREAVDTGDVLIGLLAVRGSIAARALGSLDITADAVRDSLFGAERPEEDGPSSYGVSERITFTRMVIGVMSKARLGLTETGHAHEGQVRTSEGYPYLCSGEVVLPLVSSRQTGHVGGTTPTAIRALVQLRVDLHIANSSVLNYARSTPANEPIQGTATDWGITRNSECDLLWLIHF